MRHPSVLSLSALSMLWSIAAVCQAGVLSESGYQPARCGERPVPVFLDLRDAEAFNKSAVTVNAYTARVNAYLDCLVLEGNIDIQRITKAVQTEQKSARDYSERINTEIKAADAKFGGK